MVLKFPNAEQNTPYRVVLLIPPRLPKFVESLGVKTRVNKLKRLGRLVLYCPVDFFFMFEKNRKNSSVCLLNRIPVSYYLDAMVS